MRVVEIMGNPTSKTNGEPPKNEAPKYLVQIGYQLGVGVQASFPKDPVIFYGMLESCKQLFEEQRKQALKAEEPLIARPGIRL